MTQHSRQWRTVGVSAVAHAAAIFLLIAVPLAAMDQLPTLEKAIKYVDVELKMPDPPRAAPPVTHALAAEPTPAPTVPVAAPETIAPERPPAPPAVDLGPSVPGAGVPGGVPGGLPGAVGAVPLPERPQAPPPATVRPGGDIKAPERLVFVRPIYPDLAINARVSGSVFIEALIDVDGLVKNARVIKSIPLLDQAALAAVRQWRYTPTRLNGVPVSVVMTVTVTFTLGGGQIAWLAAPVRVVGGLLGPLFYDDERLTRTDEVQVAPRFFFNGGRIRF